MLQNLARYVFSSGNTFDSGHHLDANGTMVFLEAIGDTGRQDCKVIDLQLLSYCTPVPNVICLICKSRYLHQQNFTRKGEFICV